ncbi:MAG: SDR family oxidoreductase [Acidimicrobiia bacterium]|nr:MAG: SDR family oxidoreductase [Acidimicrobiia bacterium]
MDLFDLTGTVVLVTGGNGGIGLAMAEGLADAGADVCIWGRNGAKNEAAVAGLEAHGTRVEAMVVDVADGAAVDDAFAATVERLGRVDACFANAGIGGGGSRFADVTEDEWRAITAINLDGVFLTLRAAVRHLMDRGEGGSLVATSSLSSVLGMPRGSAYSSSKAAVSALVRSIAVEYGRYGIRANAILPGWVETDMTAGLTSDEAFQRSQLGRTALKRWGRPDDFAGIAVYLASDASRFHTGDTIVIDGGYLVD